MYPIKASTAITVPFFVHDVNGDAVTGLTNASFTKRISKNGGAFAAMTVTITEMENGFYSIPLSTAHSDTTGLLTVVFTNAGSKQINLQWRVEAAILDDIKGDTAATLLDTGTDGVVIAAAQTVATVTTLTGHTAQTGDNYARLGAPAGVSVSADIVAVKSDTTNILVDTGTTLDGRIPAALIGGRMDANVGAISADSVAADNLELDYDGTGYTKTNSTIGTTTTNTDMRGTDNAALASVATEARLSELDTGTVGKMANQVDIIETDTTSLNDTKIPDTISLANINAQVDTALDTAIPGVPTANSINERIKAIDVLVESGGSGDLAAVLTDTANMQPKLGSPAGASISADIADVKVDTAATLLDTAEIGTAGAGLTDLGGMSTGMKAEVNVEALDVLNTDTFAEPGQGAPAATASLVAKIGYLYKFLRNRVTSTSTTISVYDDAGTTVDQKSTHSDDGSTYDRGEFGTGA